jgi:hypothetical protein
MRWMYAEVSYTVCSQLLHQWVQVALKWATTSGISDATHYVCCSVSDYV